MPELLLHGRPVHTVFDLLGSRENDLTYALGWALAKSPRLVAALLAEVAHELAVAEEGQEPAVRLQEHIPGSGFTDVEIRTEKLHLIIEAKRGWALPDEEQLSKYAASLTPGLTGAMLIAAEGSPAFATGRYPSTVYPPGGDPVPVLYRSWEQLTRLCKSLSAGASAESLLLRELTRYLRGLVNMQNHRDNMVYVVSVGEKPTPWSPISPRKIVSDHGHYFHPVGGGAGGWPKEPPNYLGFRYDGRLQQIHHVDDVEVTQRPRDFLPGFGPEYDFEEPHYLLHARATDHPTARGEKRASDSCAADLGRPRPAPDLRHNQRRQRQDQRTPRSSRSVSRIDPS